MFSTLQLVGIAISVASVKKLGRRGCLLLSHIVMAVGVACLASLVLVTKGQEDLDVDTTITTETVAKLNWTMPLHDSQDE